MKQAGGGEGPPTPSPPKGRAGSSSLRDGHQKGGASALSKLASESASATLQLIQQWASQPSGTVQRKAEQSLLKSLMEKNVQLSLDLEREARRIGARQDRRRRTLAQAVAAATEAAGGPRNAALVRKEEQQLKKELTNLAVKHAGEVQKREFAQQEELRELERAHEAALRAQEQELERDRLRKLELGRASVREGVESELKEYRLSLESTFQREKREAVADNSRRLKQLKEEMSANYDAMVGKRKRQRDELRDMDAEIRSARERHAKRVGDINRRQEEMIKKMESECRDRVDEASRAIDKETTEKLAEVGLVGERQKLVLEERLKNEFAHAKEEAERAAEEKRGAFEQVLQARRKRGEQRATAAMKAEFDKWRKEQEKVFAKKRKEYAANFRALVEREKAEREKQRRARSLTNASAEEELKNLKKELSDRNNRVWESEAKRKVELQGLKDKVSTMAKQIGQAQIKLKKKAQALKQAENELKKLRSENREEHKHGEDSDAKLLALQKELERLQVSSAAEVEALKSRVAAAKKTEATLQRKVDSLLEDIASVKAEAKTLRERAERAEHDPSIAKARLALEREQRREAAIAIQRIVRGRRDRVRSASMQQREKVENEEEKEEGQNDNHTVDAEKTDDFFGKTEFRGAFLQLVEIVHSGERSLYSERISSFKALFHAIDKDNGNSISSAELCEALRRLDVGLPSSEVDGFVSLFDFDRNDEISEDEFLSIMAAGAKAMGGHVLTLVEQAGQREEKREHKEEEEGGDAPSRQEFADLERALLELKFKLRDAEEDNALLREEIEKLKSEEGQKEGVTSDVERKEKEKGNEQIEHNKNLTESLTNEDREALRKGKEAANQVKHYKGLVASLNEELERLRASGGDSTQVETPAFKDAENFTEREKSGHDGQQVPSEDDRAALVDELQKAKSKIRDLQESSASTIASLEQSIDEHRRRSEVLKVEVERLGGILSTAEQSGDGTEPERNEDVAAQRRDEIELNEEQWEDRQKEMQKQHQKEEQQQEDVEKDKEQTKVELELQQQHQQLQKVQSDLNEALQKLQRTENKLKDSELELKRMEEALKLETEAHAKESARYRAELKSEQEKASIARKQAEEHRQAKEELVRDSEGAARLAEREQDLLQRKTEIGLEAKIQPLRTENNALAAELTNARDRIHAVEERLQERTDALDALRLEHADSVATLEATRNAHDALKEELSRMIHERDERASSATTAIKERDEEDDKRREEVVALKAETRRLRSEVDAERALRERAEHEQQLRQEETKELREQQAGRDTILQDEIQSLRSQMEGANDRVAKAAVRVREVEQEMEALKVGELGKRNVLEEQLTRVKAELDKAVHAGEQRAAVLLREGQLSRFSDEQQEARVEMLRSDLARVKGELQREASASAASEQRIAELQREVGELRAAARQAVLAQDGEARRLAHESEKHDHEMNLLRSRHSALEQRCHTLTESLATAKADADGFQKALADSLSREKETVARIRKQTMEEMAAERNELHMLRERHNSATSVENELSLALERSAKRVAEKAAECKMLKLKLGRLGVEVDGGSDDNSENSDSNITINVVNAGDATSYGEYRLALAAKALARDKIVAEDMHARSTAAAREQRRLASRFARREASARRRGKALGAEVLGERIRSRGAELKVSRLERENDVLRENVRVLKSKDKRRARKLRDTTRILERREQMDERSGLEAAEVLAWSSPTKRRKGKGKRRAAQP